MPQEKKSKEIPVLRRVLVTDPSKMPHNLNETPGGTLFGTTPGGTRIVYERAFLMSCRNSPLANTPPKGMGTIPEEIVRPSLKSSAKIGSCGVAAKRPTKGKPVFLII